MRAMHLFLLGALVWARAAHAGWPTTPDYNLPISQSRGDQYSVCLTTDGSGGAFFAWQDSRYNNFDVYGAHVLLDGSVLWTQYGCALADSVTQEQSPVIDADGAGGAVLAWNSGASGNAIFVQRLDGDGARLWATHGVCVTTLAPGTLPRMVGDGRQGAIVAWLTCRYCAGGIVKAQRLGADGSVLWTPGGLSLANTGTQDDMAAIADGQSGVFLAWRDSRGGVYAQHVDSTGTALWTANGVAVDSDHKGNYPRLALDGAGGLLLCYVKNISVDYIYAQHLNALGQCAWASSGVPVAPGWNAGRSSIAVDGQGGAIIGFDSSGESYTVGGSNVRAQRLSAAGVRLWSDLGVPVCSAAYTQRGTRLLADGAGGAYLVWEDSRATADFGDYDIYAQRLDASGAALWTTDGIAVCTATGNQDNPVAMLSGAGGLFVSWDDPRGRTADLYAQHVDPDGALGLVVSATDGGAARPEFDLRLANPARGRTRVELRLATPAAFVLQVHDAAGRLCLQRRLGLLPAGTRNESIDLTGMASGVYVVSLRSGSRSVTRKLAVVR